MKERKTRLVVLISALIIAACCFAISYGVDAAPGSASDPVVTKSYVDSVVAALQTKIEAIETSQNVTGSAVTASSFTVVTVPAGSKLIGGEGAQFILRSGTAVAIDNGVDGVSDLTAGADLKGGAGSKLIGAEGTQFILRSGSATAIDNGANGVSDLTAGKDLSGGTAVEKNHLLLVPRADGRGISCSTKCYVMVLGEYTLQ